MERGFGMQWEITAGGRGQRQFAGVETPAVTTTKTMGVDEAFLNGCFSELSFQSILHPTQTPTPASSSLNYYSPYGAGVSAASHAHFQYPALSYGCFEQTFPASETTPTKDYSLSYQDLKMPKDERFDSQEFAFQLLNLNNAAGVSPEPMINFFSASDDVPVDGVCNDFTGGLSSSEQRRIESTEVARHTPTYHPGSLNDIVTGKHCQLIPKSSSSSSHNRVNQAKNRYMPYSKSADTTTQRRQKISEKTRRLQRLLPWDKKMDTGTMLEETYKYVKFLQAQVSILQTMPPQSITPLSNPINDAVWGELGNLNRQQLLQVMVNSPAAQTLLYSRGCCVYSGEQLVLFQKLAEKKALWEQMMFAPAQARFPY